MQDLLDRHSALQLTRRLIHAHRDALGDLATDAALRSATVDALMACLENEPDTRALCAHFLCDLTLQLESLKGGKASFTERNTCR